MSRDRTGNHLVEEQPVSHKRVVPTQERSLGSCTNPTLTRLGETHRSHTFRESDWLSQLQQRDVMIVRVDVEVPMSDDGRDGAHDGRRF